MCQFKSALCLKDRVFVPDYDSHDRMLDELKISDDMRHASTTFVRVEVVPPDGDKLSDPMGWEVRVDQDILPEWFIPEIDHPRIRQAVAEWCAAHVLPEDVHTVKDGKWIVVGSTTVEAYGSTTVEAYDSATVKAHGSATVKAYDSATVKAYDSTTVEAYDSATVKAYGSATVEAYGSTTVEAYGSTTVEAYDSATVEARNSATVKAYDSAIVKAYDSATVILPLHLQTDKPVELNGNAICINHRDHTIRSAVSWRQIG